MFIKGVVGKECGNSGDTIPFLEATGNMPPGSSLENQSFILIFQGNQNRVRPAPSST
jgi:hypothetical protein